MFNNSELVDGLCFFERCTIQLAEGEQADEHGQEGKTLAQGIDAEIEARDAVDVILADDRREQQSEPCHWSVPWWAGCGSCRL